MLYANLLRIIIIILAENGETRVLTILGLINSYIKKIKVREPMVFEYIFSKEYILRLPFYYVRVDWGDGYRDNITYNVEHKYDIQSNNKYRVKIYNDSDNNNVKVELINRWADDIKNFISIGRIGINLYSLFGMTNFNGIIYPNWDTSNITNMGHMFYYAYEFNRKIPDNWDTSKVVDMSYMFCGAKKFNQKIGDNWDTSQVINMRSMFCNAHEFTQKIGDNWNTSRVTDMSHMFRSAANFNQKIGDNWDTSRVINMSYMFSCAYNFNQKIGDNWDTSNVEDISYIFRDALKFTHRIGDKWNTSKIKRMYSAFSYNFPVENFPSWYIKN